jgi:hypothetical protein
MEWEERGGEMEELPDEVLLNVLRIALLPPYPCSGGNFTISSIISFYFKIETRTKVTECISLASSINLCI